MTNEEAATILAVMASAWPRTELSEPQVKVWADQLRFVDPDDALEAARALIRTEEWFPTIAKFVDTCQAIARNRRLAAPAIAETSESDDRRLSKAENLEQVRELRGRLRAWAQRDRSLLR